MVTFNSAYYGLSSDSKPTDNREMGFDPVSYLMGKKSGGGGGGSSVANALFVTLTQVNSTTMTADFTAGQIAEMMDSGARVCALTGSYTVWFYSRTDYVFDIAKNYPSNRNLVFALEASSADSTTFTILD